MFNFRHSLARLACGLFFALGVAGRGRAEDVGRPIVIGRSYILTSSALHGSRTINVYAPKECIGAGVSCPTLYLLDGGIDEDFLHVVGTSQVLAENGNARQIIIVGVAGVDRRHDLTSPTSLAADLKALPTSGGAQDYRRFLVSELKPWITEHYPSTGRSALMGESLAGLFTLETLFSTPAAFDDYVVVSPSIWWNGGALATRAKDALNRNLSGHRLWLDFEAVVAPGSPVDREAAAYRSQQDNLGAAASGASPTHLTAIVQRSAEPHNAVSPGAVFAAMRALYPAEGR